MHVNVIKTHCETISSAVHVICCSDKVSAAPSGIPSKVGAIPRKDDIEYDESAVTAIMGLFNVGMEEACQIYKQNLMAAKQVQDRTNRRLLRPSEAYDGVPQEDLARFALMSDKERKKYMQDRTKKMEAAPTKKQHKKQVSHRRKKNWEQAETTVGSGKGSDDDMPGLSSDSDDDEVQSDCQSDFDTEEEFGYRANKKKSSSKKSVSVQGAKGKKVSKKAEKHSPASEPKTPAQTTSRHGKPRAPKSKKPMPAAANLKVNTTHHPFISTAPLAIGAPVFSGFVGGFELPSAEESPEEELTLTRTNQSRIAPSVQALMVDDRVLGSPPLATHGAPSTSGAVEHSAPARPTPSSGTKQTSSVQGSTEKKQRGRPRKDCAPVYESDDQYLTEEPFQVVFKAIGGEETIQTWVDETNYRADRYFDSGRNMEEEEKERENDYELGAGDNVRHAK